MRLPSCAYTPVVVVLASIAAVTASAREPLKGIPLAWSPTRSLSEMDVPDATGLDRVSIRVEPFSDRRTDRQLIGEYREDPEDILPVTTRDDVAAFSTDRVAKLLDRLGFRVGENAADVTLTADVKSFFVSETQVYLGDVALRFELRDGGGRVLWSGLSSGSFRNFGRTYKARNYYETLSDSLIDAVFRLVRNPAFRAALASAAGPKV